MSLAVQDRLLDFISQQFYIEKDEINLDILRQAAATAARAARDLKVSRYSTVVHGAHSKPGMAAAMQALVEGILLGLYRFRELKSHDADEDHDVETVTVVESDQESIADLQEGARVGEIVAEATCLSRRGFNGFINLG